MQGVRAKSQGYGANWKFITLHRSIIRKECFASFQNRADAEDANAEATLHIFNRLNSIDHRQLENPEAWVRRVSRNYCIDSYRRLSRQYSTFTPLDDNQTHSNPCPERQNTLSQEVKKLNRAFQALPDSLKTVLLKRCIEGASYNHIAELQLISEGNARKRVQLARRQLRAEM